jgi:hypothetical protein
VATAHDRFHRHGKLFSNKHREADTAQSRDMISGYRQATPGHSPLGKVVMVEDTMLYGKGNHRAWIVRETNQTTSETQNVLSALGRRHTISESTIVRLNATARATQHFTRLREQSNSPSDVSFRTRTIIMLRIDLVRELVLSSFDDTIR